MDRVIANEWPTYKYTDFPYRILDCFRPHIFINLSNRRYFAIQKSTSWASNFKDTLQTNVQPTRCINNNNRWNFIKKINLFYKKIYKEIIYT